MSLVKSPCNGICIIDEESLLCVGCSRTSEEIASWDDLSDENKIAILDKVKERLEKSDEKN